MLTMSANPQRFHHILQAPTRYGWALWLLLATGCSSGSGLHAFGAKDAGSSGGVTGSGGLPVLGGDTGSGGLAGSGGVTRVGVGGGTAGTIEPGGAVGRGGTHGLGGSIGSGGLTGSGGATRTGGVMTTGGLAGAGGTVRTGGVPGLGGNMGSGGLIGLGGATPTGGVVGTGGIGGNDGAVRTGGASGLGGVGGMGGTAGTGVVFGMPCTTKQDCPSSATCCDGSEPSCDGTRLPSGDSANPGELVVSADGLTVTDTITGLVWQRDGSGTRAVCITDSSNLRCLWAEAEAYCASLVLGGLSGWRLPGWMELLTIIDSTMDATSTIDQKALPNTATEPYWTSSPFGVFQTELYISFSDSTVGYCNDTTRRVRCVRGSRCYPTTRFSVLDGGLVRDTLTGLVWQQQGSSTAMNWADAKNYCSSLVSGGSGFRLPTLKELDSLVDPTVATGPTLDKTAFPSTGTNLYWTSSPLGPDASLSGRALCGDFSNLNSNSCTNGPENTAKVADKLMVRCVR